MVIVAIAWLYVTVMMAVAEATSSNGTVLGAFVTLVLYGLLPVALVLYLMGSPARRRANRQRDAATQPQEKEARAPAFPPEPSVDPDAGSHATAAPQGDAVAPVRKEP